MSGHAVISKDPIALSVEDAAGAIGVSERQIWRMIGGGEIETRKLGRRTLILYQSLKTYIEALPPAA